MKRSLPLLLSAAGVVLLSACGPAPVADNPGAPPPTDGSAQAQQQQPPRDARGGSGGQFGRGPQLTPQDMQKFIDEANAASDKTVLTKDQFQTEYTTLRDAARAKMIAQNPNGQPSAGGPRFGTGGQRGFGANSSRNPFDRLATATTFWKYTDPSGAEVLLAIDASNNVVMKWPMSFNRGGQPPVATPPAAPAPAPAGQQ